jgi:hypothetical protein
LDEDVLSIDHRRTKSPPPIRQVPFPPAELEGEFFLLIGGLRRSMKLLPKSLTILMNLRKMIQKRGPSSFHNLLLV